MDIIIVAKSGKKFKFPDFQRLIFEGENILPLDLVDYLERLEATDEPVPGAPNMDEEDLPF